jgi:WD40-like Beta Propeller Repeat
MKVVLNILTAIALTSVVAAHRLQPKIRFDFASPTNLGFTVNSPNFDGGPSISRDGLALYLTSDRAGGSGGGDLWVTKRAKPTEIFGVPQNLGATINSPANEFAPSISADGLSIYFDSDRPGGLGSFDIWVATRATTAMVFETPRNLGAAVNSNAGDGLPNISADGLWLYFCSRRGGGSGDMDLWVARRTTTSQTFAAAENLGPVVNSPHYDGEPSISADGLYLFFSSDRPGGFGNRDIWVTARSSLNAPFSQPWNLGAVLNSPAHEVRPSISTDDSVLFFMSDRPGGSGGIDLWQTINHARARRILKSQKLHNPQKALAE